MSQSHSYGSQIGAQAPLTGASHAKEVSQVQAVLENQRDLIKMLSNEAARTHEAFSLVLKPELPAPCGAESGSVEPQTQAALARELFENNEALLSVLRSLRSTNDRSAL